MEAILSASFNSDNTRLAIGFRSGFAIFSLSPFSLIFRSDYGGCSLAEVLDQTNLVAVAGADDSPSNPSRRIQTWTIGEYKQVITQTMFHTPVLNLKINKSNLIVVRETTIHIFSSKKLDAEVATLSTESNPRGVVALTQSGERNTLIAYPPKAGRGTVEIYDVHNLSQRRTFPDLHQQPIRIIQFSPDGTLMATASDSGTWIRVTAVENGDNRYWKFLRGRTEAVIDSISFSADQKYVCCSSNHNTLHIWRLNDSDFSTSLAVSVAEKASTGLLSLLPGEDKTSVATYNLNKEGRHCVAAFSPEDSCRIYCATDDGKLSVVQINPATKSGKLEKEWELFSYDSKKDKSSSSDTEDDITDV